MTPTQSQLVAALANGLLAAVPQEYQPIVQSLEPSLDGLAADELEQLLQAVMAATAAGTDPLLVRDNLTVQALADEKTQLTALVVEMAAEAEARAAQIATIGNIVLGVGVKALLAAI